MASNQQGQTPIPSLFTRMETEITNYRARKIELSEGVFFSQYRTIQRIYKFKNRDLSGSKLNEDLSYNYYFDITAPRADSETKNLRFDTKHILVFSQNPRGDFPAVFISNAMIKKWMSENGEDDKLKASIEEFTANGNIGFKKVAGGYEAVDALNTSVTNQKAETVDDTDLIERHELTASQIMAMDGWDEGAKEETIKELGNKMFKATEYTTQVETTAKRYEVFEFTGEISEFEFNELSEGNEEGDKNKYILAKVIVAGLRSQGESGGTNKKYTLFAEELSGVMSDHYLYAHRGKYEGRFWRVGMYELLFDHQIRANEIGNQLARGLDWASKVVFKSSDSRVLQNIRADLDNGDVVIADDLDQVEVRMQGMDQLIADWNRLIADANSLSHSTEVVTGESLPSGTPFRLGALLDQNAGKMFVLLRQKITLPYRRVFKDWVLKDLLKDLKSKDIFNLTGDAEVVDQLRMIMVETWYIENLVAMGPHNKAVADAIKEEKMEELKQVDPTIENSKEIWEGVFKRLFITITGENSDMADNIQDIVNLLSLEKDPGRIAYLLDSIYKIRGIP
ncbi:hypothetical protein LCGC14_1956210, partial [marine sediment metagenome]